VETAAQRGVRSFLIDDASCIQAEWLQGVGTVLLTAGASAPEDLVQDVVGVLRTQFGASIEERQVTYEDLTFELPISVRVLATSKPTASCSARQIGD
jgi:4-hydroxy-3-methylbut-2-enyl diphosphate reductase